MGEAKRRQPDAEKRRIEGIEKEKAARLKRELAKAERERNMTPAERRKHNTGRRLLGLMSAMAASTLNY